MNVIVGTAGHIDHGKSALVEALTGTNPDRLEEEKRRGITIDLGFAFLDLEGIRFGFVDVPGHERFVRNMLAGVGGFDLVLLVVAADESIKPQTREHFDICKLLGIPRGLVVITKSDLAEPDALELVRLEIGEFVRGSFLENAPIVPVSARTGAGLDTLRQELSAVAKRVPARTISRYIRLPIDRAFAMKGFGTVVTGTLLSGSVRVDQEVELFPSRRRVRIRGIHSGGRAVEQATAGQRTALNLAGVDLDSVRRGMVLVSPGLFEATERMDARLQLLPSARPLKNRARVHFHQGTAECTAEVMLLDRAQLAPGESCFAQLHLAEPALLLPGDRFIVRQFSPVITIGGGMVLDNRAAKHSKRRPFSRALLEALEDGEPAEILTQLLDDARNRGGLGAVPLRETVVRAGWMPSQALETARALEQAGQARLLGSGGEANQGVIAAAAWEGLLGRIRNDVDEFHRRSTLSPGMPKRDLLATLAKSPLDAAVVEVAIAELVARRELDQSGELLKRAGREVTLQPEEAKAREQIEREFERAGLAVPAVKDVLAKLPVERQRAQKILQLLLREQVLVKVTEDLLFHRNAMARLRELLAGHKRQEGDRITVPAFKELTGVTRKYAIPLLEHLDRSGATRRAGDERVILL